MALKIKGFQSVTMDAAEHDLLCNNQSRISGSVVFNLQVFTEAYFAMG